MDIVRSLFFSHKYYYIIIIFTNYHLQLWYKSTSKINFNNHIIKAGTLNHSLKFKNVN